MNLDITFNSFVLIDGDVFGFPREKKSTKNFQEYLESYFLILIIFNPVSKYKIKSNDN